MLTHTGVFAAGATLPTEPNDLLSSAADKLAATTAKGGGGYTFEIVQRSTVTARPGGPQVPIPDPIDPRGKPPTYADTYYLGGLVETGVVRPEGFSMAMRQGPATPDTQVDVSRGDLLFSALVKEGETYRDDGEGWYPTEDPPGIGLDPKTAALLPTFLRQATDARDLDPNTAPGELDKGAPSARAVEATGKVADLPGVVAVDGASFTELVRTVVTTFDAEGRLTSLVVTARNTNMDAFDLIVVTEITFHYDAVPDALPDPVPALPASTPAVQP